MNKIFLKQVSSLEKIFLDDGRNKPEFNSFSALGGERFSYQIMYMYESACKTDVAISLESPIKELVSFYKVGHVPSQLPCRIGDYDDDYITTKPGLFPDVLFPASEGTTDISPVMNTLWVTVDVPKGFKAGTYPITFKFETSEDIKSVTFELKIIAADLPEQETIYTQWFHSDCIADYFNVPVFSEEHWQLIESFVKTAAECGINMILTPLFTPPLDTKVGAERPTVQLVDVKISDGKYSFGFEKLERWVNMCRKNGMKYFEMSHLFTQWGAEFTPKIIAEENGEEKRIFGWDVRADDGEYEKFLDAFLPELKLETERLGIKDVTYFHVSDEPSAEHLKSYEYDKNMLMKHLGDYAIMDALSDFDFYSKGVSRHPVVSLQHLETFIENNVPDLWTYTCCAPGTTYSNRFFAMPSGRNRILGIQMYKYDVKGFLHWGYNFYNTQLSVEKIDPYKVTDAGCAFQSGDSFSVYPYDNGAIHSIRSRVFYDALQDMRALKLLESKIGKDGVEKLIDSDGELTLKDYPKDYTYILKLRDKINNML